MYGRTGPGAEWQAIAFQSKSLIGFLGFKKLRRASSRPHSCHSGTRDPPSTESFQALCAREGTLLEATGLAARAFMAKRCETYIAVG